MAIELNTTRGFVEEQKKKKITNDCTPTKIRNDMYLMIRNRLLNKLCMQKTLPFYRIIEHIVSSD